jgi:ADP-L-glycero-D-manno-heptose 6-epimerase
MLVVTGAAGFVGSNLARRLAALGHELWLVDHPLTTDKQANFATVGPHRFSDHERFLRELPAEGRTVEAVFHLGACSRTTETDWQYLRRNNVEYTQTLWAWCAAKGKPFVYASSAATYGDGSLGFDDHTPPDRLCPLNLYGRSKNDFDIWAHAEVSAGRPVPPSWAGLKFFNVYGPGEAHKGGMASVVWQAYRQVRSTGEVRLFRSLDPAVRDGEQRRDFVFVEDCIDHMLWLWKHPHGNGLFNSGTGLARTFLDLTHAVFAALCLPPRVRFIDTPAALAGQYQNYTRAEMHKLRDAGYTKPPTPLEEGVRRYLSSLNGEATAA